MSPLLKAVFENSLRRKTASYAPVLHVADSSITPDLGADLLGASFQNAMLVNLLHDQRQRKIREQELKKRPKTADDLLKAYGASELPSELLNNPNPEYGDGTHFQRRLGHKDILSAEKDMNVPFSKLGLLPVFDKGDNNFVVYDFRNKKWKMFNIADGTQFNEGKPLGQMLGMKASLRDRLLGIPDEKWVLRKRASLDDAKFNYGWDTETDAEFFGKKIKLPITAQAYHRTDGLSPVQRQAFATFEKNKAAQLAEIERLAREYASRLLAKGETVEGTVRNPRLTISRAGELAALMDFDKEPDNGIAAVLGPKPRVTSQDEYL
jgi:hypothetical protein